MDIVILKSLSDIFNIQVMYESVFLGCFISFSRVFFFSLLCIFYNFNLMPDALYRRTVELEIRIVFIHGNGHASTSVMAFVGFSESVRS